MKPEPLKDKRIQCEEYLDVDCFDYEDIKSAVEWLKERISNYPTKDGQIINDVLNEIDKAFEDVIKEEDKSKE